MQLNIQHKKKVKQNWIKEVCFVCDGSGHLGVSKEDKGITCLECKGKGYFRRRLK